MKELVEKQRTEVIEGFQKKSGTGTYKARLVLNEEFKVKLEFDNNNNRPVSELAAPPPVAVSV
jgi:hypothetical protein